MQLSYHYQENRLFTPMSPYYCDDLTLDDLVWQFPVVAGLQYRPPNSITSFSRCQQITLLWEIPMYPQQPLLKQSNMVTKAKCLNLCVTLPMKRKSFLYRSHSLLSCCLSLWSWVTGLCENCKLTVPARRAL